MLEYNVVITLPLLYGIDFGVTYFHQVIAFFEGNSFDIVSAFKSLQRADSLIDNRVTICMERMHGSFRCPSLTQVEHTLSLMDKRWQDVLNSFITNHPTLINNNNKYINSIDKTTDISNKTESKVIKDPFSIMLRNTTHSKLKSDASFLQLLAIRIYESGDTLCFASLTDILEISS